MNPDGGSYLRRSLDQACLTDECSPGELGEHRLEPPCAIPPLDATASRLAVGDLVEQGPGTAHGISELVSPEGDGVGVRVVLTDAGRVVVLFEYPAAGDRVVSEQTSDSPLRQ